MTKRNDARVHTRLIGICTRMQDLLRKEEIDAEDQRTLTLALSAIEEVKTKYSEFLKPPS